MNAFLDRFAEPGLWFLAEWSLRWAMPIAAMAVVLAVRPPRRARTRHLLGVLVLTTGLLLPLIPRWGPGLWRAERGASPSVVASVPPRVVVPIIEPIAQNPLRINPPTLSPTPPMTTASTPIEPLGFRRWVVLGLSVSYASVVCLLMVRLLVGRWLVIRMRRETIPVGVDSAGLLASCSAEVGLRRRVGVAAHLALGSPVAVGGRTPMVLVPADWDAQPESVRRACLLHELTHLVRRDDWSKWGLELVRVAFFYDPMVRWLLARLDREREVLCDEAAVARGVDPRDYARMLLEFARRPGVLLAPGTLPFFEKSTVKPRIEHLLEDDMKRWITPLPTRRALAMAGVVLASALGLGSARVVALATVEASPAPAPPAPALVVDPVIEEGPSVRIQGKVIDAETRQPITHYVVQDGRPDPKDPSRIVWGWSEGRIESDNPEGTLRETLSGKGSWKRVFADGYLPQPITAKPYDGETGTIELVVALRRGKQIIGRVLDPAGKPVSGASVFLVGGRASSNITGGQAVRSMIGGEDRTVTKAITDANGRFTLTGAGSEAKTVAVSAPKLDLWLVPAPPEGKELDITLPEPGKMVIRYDIEGAEPEATIFLQLLRKGREGWDVVENLREPKVTNQGRIELDNLTAGTYDISRFKKNLQVGDIGLSPFLDRQSVVVEAGRTAEVAFVRETGSAVEGVVVGLKELKLPGAFVFVNRGDEAKEGKPDRFATNKMEALVCDDSGRFKTPRLLPGTYTIVAEGYTPETPEQRRFTGWRVADQRAFAVVTVPKDGPAPAIRIEMPKPKHDARPAEKAVEKKQARADDAPQPATLTVQGQVIDATTGRPIDRFRLIPGAIPGVGVTWQPHLISNHEGGQFVLLPNARAWAETRFRVEAEGYRPVVSRVVKKAERTATLEFALEPDPGITAVVRSPDGAPAVGAQATWATLSREATGRGATITLSGHGQRLGAQVVTADVEGRFHLPPECDPGVIVVAHESGYAEVAPAIVAASGVVELRTWCRVEGRVLSGTKPVAAQTVWIYRSGAPNYDSPAASWDSEATTDADGRFSCDKLVAGRLVVDRVFLTGRLRSSVHGLATSFEVVEGQVTRLTIGGPGRTLVGRIEAPKELVADLDWSKVHAQIGLKAPHIGFPGDEADWERYKAFLMTDQGKSYLRDGLHIGPDGAIRIEAVPTGGYLLTVWIDGPAVGKPAEPGIMLAIAGAQIEVAPTPDDRGDHVQQIGTIALRAPTGGKAD